MGTQKPEPATIADCDKEISDYRKILAVVSPKGRVAVWEQIDALLERRFVLEKRVATRNCA